MDVLKQFYDNEYMREALKEFLINMLKERAVDKVFEKGTTAGIYEAKKLIDISFNKLEEMYGKTKVQEIPNSR